MVSPNFIYTKKILTPEQCQGIIDAFESHPDKYREGFVGNGIINPSVKESTDFCFHLGEKQFIERAYGNLIETVIDKLTDCVSDYKHKFEILHEFNLEIDEFNLQKYLPGQGFKKWHSEQRPSDIRVFVWMVYLNDVPDGGTEFLYQEHTEKAEQGKLVFFPADWTYTHRGQVSQTTTKYILTGWIVETGR